MKGVLLDTHVFLWLLSDPKRVSESVREALRDSDVSVWVSAATVWEIATKRASGKLNFSGDISETVRRLAFRELAILGRHCQVAAELPWHHKDPFDRLLIAQASVENLVLISKDKIMAAYDVALLRA